MSPNPNHNPENGQFTTPPEQSPEPAQESPWAALEQAGITPEQAMQGGRVWQGLNALDRRQETLQSIIRPDIDTWIGQQPEQPPDPLAQYVAPEYEEEYVPQQPQMPDFHQFGTEVKNAAVAEALAAARADWQQQLQQMMADQAITEAATSAVKSAGLPESMAPDIEYRARMLAQEQRNRAPGDIANELARQRADELRAWAAQSGPAPIGSPSTPGGPVPSVHSAGPPDGVDPAKWALERSREGLD